MGDSCSFSTLAVLLHVSHTVRICPRMPPGADQPLGHRDWHRSHCLANLTSPDCLRASFLCPSMVQPLSSSARSGPTISSLNPRAHLLCLVGPPPPSPFLSKAQPTLTLNASLARGEWCMTRSRFQALIGDVNIFNEEKVLKR